MVHSLDVYHYSCLQGAITDAHDKVYLMSEVVSRCGGRSQDATHLYIIYLLMLNVRALCIAIIIVYVHCHCGYQYYIPDILIIPKLKGF